MDEEELGATGKKITIANFFESIKKIDKVANDALESSKLNLGKVDAATEEIENLKKIVAVAMLTPKVRHWLPTREPGILKSFFNEGLSLPGNLAVRVSATMIDGKPHANVGLTSTVHKEQAPIGYSCPASKQGNECKTCRACWNINIKNVSYGAH